jgi:hypothetical protein
LMPFTDTCGQDVLRYRPIQETWHRRDSRDSYFPKNEGQTEKTQRTPKFKLTSWVWRVRDPVVAFLPVDKLDLNSLKRWPSATRGLLVRVHDGPASARLGKAVALFEIKEAFGKVKLG